MKFTYRLKLFLVLIAFAIVITFSIATIDYFRLKERTIKENETQIEHVTNSVKHALETVDKAYLYLDEDTAEKMSDNTFFLQEKYEKNSDFSTWDFDELASAMKMDIYILNRNNQIIHSNVAQEVGLDFSICCASFDEVLTERRKSGELFIDGIDIEQQSGEVKKFSYMATEDKKYLIELGYNLENEPIFNEFNFIEITEKLTENFTIIEKLHVLNFGGLPFSTSAEEALSSDRKEAFKAARESNEIVEIESVYKGDSATIRYIPYVSAYDTGSTKIKVLEMVYNKQELANVLKENKTTYIVQLIIILLVTLIVTLGIANWFAKPIYLAYHDNLTGLKNRASFDDYLQNALIEQKQSTALLMIDLDNFKLVNDLLGHIKGDYLLKIIAQTMQASISSEYEVFRLGGDEFAVIMIGAKKKEAEDLAQYMIDTLKERIQQEKDIKTLSVTLSIGIVISDKETSPEELYKRADIALYKSKEKGKNQFQVYEGGESPTIPFIS